MGDTIGVITPYKAQAETIMEQLEEKNLVNENDDRIQVKTIDGYQGTERDIVIFSAVRCDHFVGFLDNPRRLNVMLTRAKNGLIVIGHHRTLSSSEHWRRWLSDIWQRGLIQNENEIENVDVSNENENIDTYLDSYLKPVPEPTAAYRSDDEEDKWSVSDGNSDFDFRKLDKNDLNKLSVNVLNKFVEKNGYAKNVHG